MKDIMIRLLYFNGGSVLFITQGSGFRYKAIPPTNNPRMVKSFTCLSDAIAYAKTGVRL